MIITMNCVVSFEPVGCNDVQKLCLTVLYHINVRLTVKNPQLNAVNPNRFYNSYIYSPTNQSSFL